MPSQADEKVTLRTWIAVFGSMLGAFMAVLDIQITNASLREITGGISSTSVEASWISTSYLIGEIVTIPLTAWLSRVFGLRWYLLTNVALFLLFSALCGTAGELTQMVLYRALQGFTGGVMIPISFTVANTMLPPSKRPVGLALFGITATLGPAVGPYIGGLLTDSFGWQMVFYINFLPGAVMLAAIAYSIDAQPPNFSLLRQGDWFGIACMAIGLGSLIAFLEEGQNQDWFTSTFIQHCFELAVVFIPLFLIIEIFGKHPVVSLRLLLNRNLALSCVVNFVMGAGLYGSVFLLPQYLEQVFGGPQFQLANVIRALGQPFTIVPLSAIATAGLMREQQGDGSALFNIARNLGGSVGTALLSTMITQREQFHDFRIGERVTAYSLQVQRFLTAQAAHYDQLGGDPAMAMKRAYKSLQSAVQLSSFVMAFSECFLVVGCVLLAGSLVVWFCHKAKAGTAGGGH
jgi:DHA2 family multidrug resistance protein